MMTDSPPLSVTHQGDGFAKAPRVSILVATYNRSTLLRRALASIFKQDYDDYEVIIIDDCSTDDTPQVVAGYTDPRIRYIRNPVNQGAKHGDRIHLRRCVHELMRGEYFMYLCDDDFWLPHDLLSRQVAAFDRYPTLAMAVGSQAHSWPAHTKIEIGPIRLHEISPTTFFTPGLYPAGFIKGFDYLDLLAEDPHPRNVLEGATMFSRDAFIKARVFATDDGASWQAGYEFKLGPGSIGDAFYIDEPCIIAGVEAGNASFRGTQFDHFHDCLKAVEVACRNVYPALDAIQRKTLEPIRRKLIRNITQGFINNRLSYKLGYFNDNPVDHTHMFTKNVTPWVVLRAYGRYGVVIGRRQLIDLLWSAATPEQLHEKKRRDARKLAPKPPKPPKRLWRQRLIPAPVRAFLRRRLRQAAALYRTVRPRSA